MFFYFMSNFTHKLNSMSSPLKIIRLINSNGLALEVLNYGATIVSLQVPNKDNTFTNVIVGLEKPKEYITKSYIEKGLYLGSTIGRYAGRISAGGFSIENTTYTLATHNATHLHGGENGFDKKYWNIDRIEKGEEPSVTLTYFSKHLEEGYPGNLTVSVIYQLTKDNTLKVTYKAKTDATTHVNLTNHAYFNLNGSGSVYDHSLCINSTQYLEVNEQLIPTGVLKNASDTAYDFLQPTILNSYFKGLDDTFVLNTGKTKASLYSKETGILMKVKTNQPAIVVYTPSKFEGLTFKNETIYKEYPAICFETQKRIRLQTLLLVTKV